MLLMELFFSIGITAFFLLWGLKAKNPGIFAFGCLLVSGIGIMLYSDGFQTENTASTVITKTIVGGVTTYTSINNYQSVTINNSPILWGISYALMFLGFLMIFPALYVLRKTKSPPALS